MFSYDYTEMLNEFIEDINDGILNLDSKVWIIRKDTPVFENYHPIIDWFYLDDLKTFAKLEDKLTAKKMKVEDVLNEMNDMNSPF